MIVIYHANCADGFCAAWLLHKAYPDADFMPFNYGSPPPDVKGHDVIMADFSFKRPVMEQLIADAMSVTVLDHHKSARDELTGLEAYEETQILFNLEKSGGRLTADYLAANGLIRHEWANSWIVDYTQDRDLWTWKLDSSKEVNAAIAIRPFEFMQWDIMHFMPLPVLMLEGKAVLAYQRQVIDRAVPNAVPRMIAGHEVLVLNTTTLISEIGERLSEGRAFSATYFDTQGKRVWSLRSREPSGIDVSAIAKKFGGGGHPGAAGFTQPIEWIPPEEI